jgi:hypothetical protein
MIPAAEHSTLTTSDSGWIYDLATDIDNLNGLAPRNDLSRPPQYTRYEPEQGQSLIAVLMYRGLNVVNPSVTLLDVSTFYGPLIFALSIIPVFLMGRELGGDLAGISAAFFMATLTSTIYWNKAGAFDREPTLTIFAAWTMYLTIKLFKVPWESKPKFAVLAGMMYGLFGVTWSGSLYMIPIVIGGLLMLLLFAFGGKLMKKVSDPMKSVMGAIKAHRYSIIAVFIMMLTFTIFIGTIGGQPPIFWVSFTQTLLGFVGIGGGAGGGGFSTEVASEAQSAGPLGDTFSKFYTNNILTGIVFILVALAVVKILWKRKPEGLLVLAWLIILLGLVWPDKGQARFERMWWPFVPVMAGLGTATLLSIFSNLSFDPSWDWLKKFHHPMLAIVVVVMLLFCPFVVNAQDVANKTSPPPEWHGSGLDNGLLDSFNWIREHTPENSVVSIEWSFGHLMTGVTRRPALVDGAGSDFGEEGVWQTENNRDYYPPDYVYWQDSDGSYKFVSGGLDANYQNNQINGRRPDADRLVWTGSTAEFSNLVKQYRDTWGCKIDYVIFLYDTYYPVRVFNSALRSMSLDENTSNISQENNNYLLVFENSTVTVDASSGTTYVEDGGTNRYLAGYGYYWPISGKYAGPYFYTNPDLNELVLFILDESNNIVTAYHGSFVGTPMAYRVFTGNGMPDFLSVVYTSSNGYVKVVQIDHSQIV